MTGGSEPSASTRPVPTRAGTIAIGGSLLAVAGGVLAGSNPLLLLGCLAAGAVATSFLVGRASLSGLEADRRLPDPIFAGAAFDEEIRLRNRNRFLPASLVFVRERIEGAGVPRLPSFFFSAVPHVPPAGELELHAEGMFFQRGEKRFTGLECSSTFPLGLFRFRHAIPLPGEALVLPRVSPVSPQLLPESRPYEGAALPVRAAAGDEEFAGLREFRPGDNPRWIHWKSSGRLDGRLLVREFERYVIRHVEVRLETAVGGRPRRVPARFERAVRAAASLLHELVARGFSVRFEIGGEDLRVTDVRPNDGSLLAALGDLATVEPAFRPDEDSPGDDLGPRAVGTVPRLVIRPRDLARPRPLEEALRWH